VRGSPSGSLAVHSTRTTPDSTSPPFGTTTLTIGVDADTGRLLSHRPCSQESNARGALKEREYLRKRTNRARLGKLQRIEVPDEEDRTE